MICRICNRDKLREDFYWKSSTQLSCGHVCKDCVKVRSRMRYQTAMVISPERERDRRRDWKNRNPEKLSVSRKAEIKRRTPEQNRAREAAWRTKYPEKAREHSRRNQSARRARLAEAFVEPVDPQVVWERDEGVCGICGEPADHENWHMDHKIPLAAGVEAGGVHSYANVQVAHPACNQRKSDRVLAPPQEAGSFV